MEQGYRLGSTTAQRLARFAIDAGGAARGANGIRREIGHFTSVARWGDGMIRARNSRG